MQGKIVETSKYFRQSQPLTGRNNVNCANLIARTVSDNPSLKKKIYLLSYNHVLPDCREWPRCNQSRMYFMLFRIHLLINGTMPDNTSSCLFLLQTSGGGGGDQSLVIA